MTVFFKQYEKSFNFMALIKIWRVKASKQVINCCSYLRKGRTVQALCRAFLFMASCDFSLDFNVNNTFRMNDFFSIKFSSLMLFVQSPICWWPPNHSNDPTWVSKFRDCPGNAESQTQPDSMENTSPGQLDSGESCRPAGQLDNSYPRK